MTGAAAARTEAQSMSTDAQDAQDAQDEAPTVDASAGGRASASPVGDAVRIEPMLVAHLDAVMAIERRAYDFPWSRGNFIDSLAAGYPAWRLLDADDRLLGYCVCLRGVDEMHLLNLTVAPEQQRRGHARRLLGRLIGECRAAGLPALWLEVRAGNRRARALYARSGFVEAGVRRGYYPALPGAPSTAPGSASPREDAVLMTLDIGRPS